MSPLFAFLCGSILYLMIISYFKTFPRVQISLQDSKDEVLLRKVLYDAVILVEYSLLNPERIIHLPADRMKSLSLTRLMVTHEAIELLRYE